MSFARIRLIIWKEFLQLRRDRLILPLLFIMPLLQLIMFGYVVGADVTNLPTAIVDLDRSATSRGIATAFTNSGYFVTVASPNSEAGVRPLMDEGTAQVAIVLPPGLERDLDRGRDPMVQVIVDGSDSKIASVASGYAQQVLADFNTRRLADMGLDIEAAGIDARVRVLFNPGLRAVNAMIPGLVALILMLMTTSILSQSVVRERERGTLEQMFVTPISRGDYLVGKIVPYLIISLAQVTLVMITGTIWFDVPFNGNLLVLGSGILLFLLMTIGQGLFVSMVSHTRQQAQQTTIFILIPTMVLSGFIFPIESMPPTIVPITYLIPLRYILVILRSNWMKGSGFGALWPQFAAMAVFAIIVFTLSLTRFHKRLTD